MTRPFLICLILIFAGTLGGCSSCRRQPDAQNVLVMAVEKAPGNLDPRVGNDAVSARLHQLMFATLVNKNEQLDIVPELATFEVSPDAKTFTFRLKSGVTFHDGRPLTSGDVKYTFDTLRDKDFVSPKKGDFLKIETIDAPDPKTVVIRCKEPNAPMLVSLVSVGIIPQGSGGTISTNPVGSGPFKMVEFRKDNDITLEAYNNYFGGPPKLEKLRIRFIPDNAVRELELRQGGVQMAVNSDMAAVELEKLGQSGNLQLKQAKGTNLAHLGLNCEDPILRNVKVRQALNLAVDRESLIKNIFRNMARPAYGPLPPEQWSYPADLPKTPHDIEQAKKLLDEAGLKDPDGDGPQPRFKLEIKTSSNALSRQIATVIQEQLAGIGVQLDIRSFEFLTFLNDVISGNYQMYYLIAVGGNQHPDFLSYTYESTRIPTKANGFSEGANRSRYRNSEVDAWLKQAAATLDRAEQKRLYGLVQKKVAEEVPQIYLWYPNNTAVADKRVQNINLELSGSYYFLKNVELK